MKRTRLLAVLALIFTLVGLNYQWSWSEPMAFPTALPSSKPVTGFGTTYNLNDYRLPGEHPILSAGSAIKRTVLPNGLVILAQESTFDDIVAIAVFIRCGLSQEDNNLSGYNNLVLELLSDRISRDQQGRDDVEITGSVVSSSASEDYACLSIVTTSKHAGQMLRRIDDALSQAYFTDKEVDRVKKRLAALMDASGGALYQLNEVFLSTFYRYHPYKRTTKGSSVVVRRATAQDVNEFVGRYYSPNRLIYSISGNIKNSEVVSIVRGDLGGLVANYENTVEVQWEPKSSEREVYLSANSNIAWVLVGYPAPAMLSPDYVPMRIIHSALGEGLSSRMWLNLRETHGLAYELGARYPNLLGPSHLLCYIITRPTSVGEARRRLIAEVKRFRKEGIGQVELDETKQKIKGKYLLERETNAGRAIAVGVAELSGAGYAADAQFLQDLDKVTVDSVNRVAQRYLDNFTLIVARPGGRMFF